MKTPVLTIIKPDFPTSVVRALFLSKVSAGFPSPAETETHLMIAYRQTYLTLETLNILLEQAAEIRTDDAGIT